MEFEVTIEAEHLHTCFASAGCPRLRAGNPYDLEKQGV